MREELQRMRCSGQKGTGEISSGVGKWMSSCGAESSGRWGSVMVW